jgi:uncharacterized membrane protein
MQKAKTTRNIFLAALLFLSFPACADQEQAQNKATAESGSHSQPSYLRATNVNEDDSLNLRSEPSGKSQLVFKIPHNADGILELSRSGNWAFVSYHGNQGWAYTKYLQNTSHPTANQIFGNRLSCLGTEPHWNLSLENNHLDFKHLDHTSSFILDSRIRSSINETGIWSISAINPSEPGQKIVALVRKNEQCSDGMSDVRYRYSIVTDDGRTELFSGCCK